MIYYSSWDKLKDIGELLKEWTSKELDTSFVLWNSYFIVAREKGTNKFVGSTQLIILDDPFWNRRYGLVENVYVRKGYRTFGIGKQLMSEIEKQAKLLGCQFIKLTAGFDKKAGRELYKSLGYKEGSSFRKDL